MHRGSQIFVFVIFSILSLSFWATTISLYIEFSGVYTGELIDKGLWLKLLTHYSDLFIFFPVFGTVALIAFYTPSCALVDMYWNNAHHHQDNAIPYPRLRFIASFIALAVSSYFISYGILSGSERSLWQLKPAVLLADQGQGCSGNQCTRVSFIDGLDNVHKVSRERFMITDLARQCEPDAFVAASSMSMPSDRYCAATTTFETRADLSSGNLLSNEACCNAQKIFDDALKEKHADPQTNSLTHQIQKYTWPFNIFFLLILMAISILLAFRRSRIEREYADIARSVDRGVIIGAFAVAFLTIMNRSFLEATQLLHGGGSSISVHRGPDTFILLFTIWALLILFSFVQPANKQAELISRLLGSIFSVLFVLNTDIVTNYGIRYLGAGAGKLELMGIGIVALLLIVALAVLKHIRFLDGGKNKEAPVTEAAAEATVEAAGNP